MDAAAVVGTQVLAGCLGRLVKAKALLSIEGRHHAAQADALTAVGQHVSPQGRAWARPAPRGTPGGLGAALHPWLRRGFTKSPAVEITRPPPHVLAPRGVDLLDRQARQRLVTLLGLGPGLALLGQALQCTGQRAQIPLGSGGGLRRCPSWRAQFSGGDASLGHALDLLLQHLDDASALVRRISGVKPNARGIAPVPDVQPGIGAMVKPSFWRSRSLSRLSSPPPPKMWTATRSGMASDPAHRQYQLLLKVHDGIGLVARNGIKTRSRHLLELRDVAHKGRAAGFFQLPKNCSTAASGCSGSAPPP